MLSLRDLSALPEFGLGPCVSGPAAGADREVQRALILSGSQWMGADIANALIVSNTANLRIVDRLLGTLVAGRAAGLVLTDAPAEEDVAAIRDAATRHRFPLLVSMRPLTAWRSGLAQRVLDLAAERARRHAATLGELLGQLNASHDSVDAISRLLARELRAEVVVRGVDGIVAAVPPTAPLTLASVLQRPDRPHQTTPTGLFAGTVPLAGAGDDVLVVATPEPQTRADRDVVAHAANALAFARAPQPRQVDPSTIVTALRGIRLSAFQLLMTGNIAHAQRVLAGVAPGLLDAESARVFIVDCARADRDTVMAEVERSLDGQALAIRCPAYHQHIIVVAPEHDGHDGHDGHGTEPELRKLRQEFSAVGVSVGGSPVRPLAGVGDSYGEAADALSRAAYHPEGVVVTASRSPGLVDILPAAPAGVWAGQFLRPILGMPRAGQQILEATALALEFRTSAAARIIGVHRNTVARRVSQVCAGVGINPDRTLDRIALSLAIQIVGAHPAAVAHPSVGADSAADVSLHDLLVHPQVRTWADKMLRPLADDRRDLIRTLRTWVLAEFNADTAAARLGIATKTVRAHIRAAEPLLEKDLITGLPQDVEDEEGDGEQRLSGLRPLTVALYATTPPGDPRPSLPTGTGGRGVRPSNS